MTNQEAIASLRTLCHNCKLFPKCAYEKPECFKAIELAISALQAQEAKTQLSAEGTTSDLISRRVAVDALWEIRQKEISDGRRFHDYCSLSTAVDVIKDLPSAQAEHLTDKEQRIFLAAMGREEKVCEEVDRNYVREPYEDSLVRVCKEIRRKVKGALWI